MDSVGANQVDPRWLAGVPRPPDALPDDIGRAYLRLPWHHAQDNTPSTEERPKADPPRTKDTADRLQAHIDRPAFQDRFDGRQPPDRYGTPLERPDGTRVPCLNGPPTRGQTEQGWLGDCGVIATLGAVAAHRPDDISRRITEQPDGTYKVRLSEAQWTETGAAPTGDTIELTVSPDLPVFDKSPDISAFANSEHVAWPPVLEKAIAGLDQTWTLQRRAEWADLWKRLCENDAVTDKIDTPRIGNPPDGYARLNQGTTSWDRAELLTQLTGRESEVRSYPEDPQELKAVLALQLGDGKPVLVASRPKTQDQDDLPYNLRPGHAYEIIGVTEENVHLRNPWNGRHPVAIKIEDFSSNMQSNYTTLK